MNDEDIEVLNSFHLTDIVDFRGDDEFLYRPDVRLNNVKYHNFPSLHEQVKEADRNKDDGNLLWFVGDHTSGFEHLKHCYHDFVVEKTPVEAYRNFFKLLQEEGKTVYFHCSQGKDRAGFAAYVLERCLGVSEDDALDDYMLTNIAMDKRVDALIESVKDKPFYNESYREDLIDVFSAKLAYIEESIHMMDELYGGVIEFAELALGVDIEKLKALYLE